MSLIESFGFLTILHESIKLLPNNGKPMFFMSVILVALPSSLFGLLFIYSSRYLLLNMSVATMKLMMPEQNSYDPSGPISLSSDTDHLKLYFSLMFALYIALDKISFVISFFCNFVTTLVSADSCSGNGLSMKETLSGVGDTWKRPLITTFYISNLGLGFFTFVVVLASPLLIYPNSITISLVIWIGVTSFILCMYLSVVWGFALIMSVLDKGYSGLKALGKAATFTKGKKLLGFKINLFLDLVDLIFYLFFLWMTLGTRNKSGLDTNIMMYGLLAMNVLLLVRIFGCVAYAMLYIQCKKHHGEEIELHGIIPYAKLPSSLLTDATT